MTANAHITRLLEIMKQLRNPVGGCPWDLEQNFKTIAPYTIEEAYEVLDAIERGHMDDLREELGDLLLQVVFHAQMASEQGLFNFEDVAESIADKMVHRHPHVFGNNTAPDSQVNTADKVLQQWDQIKEQEKADKNAAAEQQEKRILDDIPLALPALLRAQKISKKAAKAGFEWNSIDDVFLKLDEEIAELKAAIKNKDQSNIQEELGDALFVMVNIARHLGVDSEESMRSANNKFINRFNGLEDLAKVKHKGIEELTPEQLDALWNEQKTIEKQKDK